MKKLVGTIRDNATKVFIVPLACIATLEQVKRELAEYVNTPSGTAPPQVYPEDFEFWTFGTFDDESGDLVGHIPEREFRLSDLKVKS